MHAAPMRWLLAVMLLPAMSLGQGTAAASAGNGRPLVLENESVRVEFDGQRGGIIRLLDKAKHVDLKSPLDSAECYRLSVPLPDAPQNYISSKAQTLTAGEVQSGKLVLRWDGPLVDQAGRKHNLATVLTGELAGQAAVLRLRLVNHSQHVVEEVWYPGLGGLLGFGPADKAGQTMLHPSPERKLLAPFGQHVVTYPGQNLPFVSLDNAAIGRGLYFGAHDPVARFKAIHLLEAAGRDKPNVVANIVHFPFTRPGRTFEAAPVVIQFHDGDWIAAGKAIYRPWFEKTFGLVTPEQDWIRRESFFQFLMIMLPEGNINYTINQIPQLARDGLKYGVKSLHISGWQRGGHDNGYPYYEPDPRLGTWDDIEQAMRRCHALGVRVYFFANIHVNTLDTEWYQKELKDYDYENRRHDRYMEVGWGMGTLAARMGHTAPLITSGDVTFPGLRDRLLDYFKRLAAAGVDGIHIDKCYPGSLSFNPRIAMSPDQSPWEGTAQLMGAIRRECRAIRPDFSISIETTWDRSLAFGAGTWWGGNMTAAKHIFPELVETVGLYQPYDYAGVNDAVRNGYAVMVAPFHFNRTMDAEAWRGLAEYIREVKRIRDELAESVFFGEYLGASQVRFGDAKPAVDYAAYRNRQSGKLACVLTHRRSVPQTVTLAGLGSRSTGSVRVFRPFQPATTVGLPAGVVIQPERLAIVVEP
jgi:hypothetical protein